MQRFAAMTMTIGLTGSLLLVWAVMARTGGHFVYTLDDPYIHLALAEEIARGTYGINPGEPAAPSSSILYPFLLVGMGFAGGWGPLILALIGQGVLLGALGVAVGRAVMPRAGLVGGALLALVCVLAVNGIALPLTGMEHTLHAGASALGVLGMAQTAQQGRVPRWLVPVLWLAAALRFEGFALAGLAALALIMAGHRRAGAVMLLGLMVLGGGFVAAMLALGLPPLPSSVMVKSQLSAAAVDQDARGVVVSVIVNLIGNLRTPQGALLALIGVVLAIIAARQPATRLYALPAALAVLAHLLLGRFGWFARYEVYAVALALTALALALRARPLWLGAALVPLAVSYVEPLVQTRAASIAVYQQHYQMHNFATQLFPQPVAVNDLGLVAWRNPAHVTDLWGLGSEDARQLTAAQGRTPETLQALTQGRATYAMIYDPAFVQGVPPEWCRMAVLDTALGALAWDSVSFYLIDPDARDDMAEALARFAPTLVDGAMMTLFECER